MPATRQSTGNDCLLWGGYGWGNTGDDLTLAVALHDMDRAGIHNVRVITPGFEHTRRTQPDVRLLAPPKAPRDRIIERLAWFLADRSSALGKDTLAARLYQSALARQGKRGGDHDLLSAFATAGSLHLVGGGYLTDLFNLDTLLRPVRIARTLDLPITTSPLGIGPFKTSRGARAVVMALRGSRVRVRDSDSLDFCQARGLQAEEHPDDGFRLTGVLPASNSGRSVRGSPPRIGICVFHQYGGDMSKAAMRWWVDCLQSVSQQLPLCRIEGFCFHTEEAMDFQTTRRLFEQCGLNPADVHPPEPDFRKAVRLLERFDGILSTRFHAVVAASALRLPCVAAGANEYYAIKMRCALKHTTSPSLLLNPPEDAVDAASRFLARQIGPALANPTYDATPAKRGVA